MQQQAATPGIAAVKSFNAPPICVLRHMRGCLGAAQGTLVMSDHPGKTV
jgi:hypothetical protein